VIPANEFAIAQWRFDQQRTSYRAKQAAKEQAAKDQAAQQQQAPEPVIAATAAATAETTSA